MYLLLSFQCLHSVLQILGFNEPLQGGSLWRPFLNIRKAFWNSEQSTALMTVPFHSSWCYFLLTASIIPPVLPFTCYKIYGITGPVKENIHSNGEITFNQKAATASFAFAFPVPIRTQFHRFQVCSPTPALSGPSPTAQTSMASSVKSSLAASWGLL